MCRASVICRTMIVAWVAACLVVAGCESASRRTQPVQTTQSSVPRGEVASTVKRVAGAPCAFADECESGECVERNGAQQCAQRCYAASDCSEGTVCQATHPRDPEAPHICMPLERERLCQACTNDNECGGMANACLAGACARDCEFDRDCGEGYECRSFDAEGNALAEAGSVVAAMKQCVTRVGTCDCNELTRGQTRPCSSANTYGVCRGVERCEPGQGYVGCSAATPALEQCNALDDDCDGFVDEQPGNPQLKLEQICGNGYGLCQGTASCDNGVYANCTAQSPQAETCDNLDNDCDGEVDEGLTQSADSCGACGAVCPPGPGLDGSTQRVCEASGDSFACGAIRCKGSNYDVDGVVANGCETSDDVPAHGSLGTAIDSGCVVDDWDNSWCAYQGRFPSDARQHTTAPFNRNGPVGSTNAEDWFVTSAEDDDFANLQVRSWLDVRGAPNTNLYEVCQSASQNQTIGDAVSCGASPGSVFASWCSGFCCCVYGGSAVGIPLSSRDTDPYGPNNSGEYYTRVRWKSGNAPFGGVYNMRVCDDSGDAHCQ